MEASYTRMPISRVALERLPFVSDPGRWSKFRLLPGPCVR